MALLFTVGLVKQTLSLSTDKNGGGYSDILQHLVQESIETSYQLRFQFPSEKEFFSRLLITFWCLDLKSPNIQKKTPKFTSLEVKWCLQHAYRIKKYAKGISLFEYFKIFFTQRLFPRKRSKKILARYIYFHESSDEVGFGLRSADWEIFGNFKFRSKFWAITP